MLIWHPAGVVGTTGMRDLKAVSSMNQTEALARSVVVLAFVAIVGLFGFWRGKLKTQQNAKEEYLAMDR